MDPICILRKAQCSPQTGDDMMPPLDMPPTPHAPVADQVFTPCQGAAALNPSSSALENTVVDQTSVCSHNTHQQTRPLAVMTIKQAITTYLQDVCKRGHKVQTVEWWHQFRVTEVHQLSRPMVQRWLANLRTTPSVLTKEKRSANTIAASARSAQAFCHWLVL
ncbi:MAG TPA: hypothetical protein VFN35_06190 [Ktedonobacteraceae bacterium]|nr:hypothetical protein [Ktedonobacteraceae bacterium]